MISPLSNNVVGNAGSVNAPDARTNGERQVMRNAASAYPLSQTAGRVGASAEAMDKAMMALAKDKQKKLERAAQEKAQAAQKSGGDQGCCGGGDKGAGADKQSTETTQPKSPEMDRLKMDWDNNELEVKSATAT